jgi:hypothetical protein
MRLNLDIRFNRAGLLQILQIKFNIVKLLQFVAAYNYKSLYLYDLFESGLQ